MLCLFKKDSPFYAVIPYKIEDEYNDIFTRQMRFIAEKTKDGYNVFKPVFEDPCIAYHLCSCIDGVDYSEDETPIDRTEDEIALSKDNILKCDINHVEFDSSRSIWFMVDCLRIFRFKFILDLSMFEFIGSYTVKFK